MKELDHEALPYAYWGAVGHCSSPTSTLGTDDLVFAYTSANGFAPVVAIFEIAISANAP